MKIDRIYLYLTCNTCPPERYPLIGRTASGTPQSSAAPSDTPVLLQIQSVSILKYQKMYRYLLPSKLA